MILNDVINFIKNWYFRYLLITELYMVERWERTVVHLLFGILFFGFWYFNSSILLNAIEGITRSKHSFQMI